MGQLRQCSPATAFMLACMRRVDRQFLPPLTGGISALRQESKLTRASPHMTVHDYNGTGPWAAGAVLKRYAELARRFHVEPPADLTPLETQDRGVRWIYPVMERVNEAIEQNDPAAIEIGIEFIQSDDHFPFGKILKSNTARALRRAALCAGQIHRIRRRVLQMLVDGRVPHEYKEYAKLLRKIGLGSDWPEVAAKVDQTNPRAMRYSRYFTEHATQSGSA